MPFKKIATAAVVCGALAFTQSSALAKGPLSPEGAAPLILAKASVTDLSVDDFPWGLKEGRTDNIRLNLSQTIPAQGDLPPVKFEYIWSMPWIEVEKTGTDSLVMTFPKNHELGLTVLEGDNPLSFDSTLSFEDFTMRFKKSGESTTYVGTSGPFEYSMDMQDSLGLSMTVKGESARMSGTGGLDIDITNLDAVDMDYEYSFEKLTYDVSMSDDFGADVIPFSASGTMKEFAADGTMRDGTMQGGSLLSDFLLNLTDPIPFNVTFGTFAYEILIPTAGSDKPQDMRYMAEMADITLDDDVWAMMDPEGVFPRELSKLAFDLQMQALMPISIFDADAMFEAMDDGAEPLIPTGVQINSIALEGLGLDLAAKGEASLENDIPDGSAFISVKGLADFIGNAVKMGLFGPQEAMMIQGMAGQLGKEDDEGALTFDLKTEAGMLVINDAPIFPIPQKMPQ